MFDPKQFRCLIKDTLDELSSILEIKGFASDDAVELLMLTAAQESHLGRYLTQISGPAKGVFQIEPSTHGDLFENFLQYKPILRMAVQSYIGERPSMRESLRTNLAYQVVIARLVYYRKSEPIPSRDDIEAMARYWKKHYNTELGKGTVQEAVNNYKRYVLEEKV